MKTLTLIFGSLERKSERQRQRERETKTVKREKIQLCSFEKTRFSSFPFFFFGLVLVLRLLWLIFWVLDYFFKIEN